MNTIKHLLYFTALSITVSCAKKQEPAEPQTDLIEITGQQFTTDSMQLGSMEYRPFENMVKCSGIIVSLPDGMAKITAPVSGVIKKINCHNGLVVNKNHVLLEITGNEVIDIQKDFANVSAGYKRAKSDYERVRSLYDEKVTSKKEFIQAESDFKSSLASYNALKLKIEAIGFSPSKIENGEFYSSYSIKSPINGHISNLNISIGSYIGSQTELLDVVNPDRFQVQLSVFSTDIKTIRKGQTVRFKTINSIDGHLATISSIGAVIDDNTKSIPCHATIMDKKPFRLIARESIESEIITGLDTVLALPSEAVLKNEAGYFILVLKKQENDKYFFKKVDVNIGRQSNGFTEIIGNKTDEKVAVKGIYNISL